MLIVMTNDANRESVRIRRIILDLHGVFKNKQPLLFSFASYPTETVFLLSLRKRFAISLTAIAMIWISNQFFLLLRSATCLSWKTLSLVVYIQARFIGLRARAVMPVRRRNSFTRCAILLSAISIFLLIINYTSNAL